MRRSYDHETTSGAFETALYQCAFAPDFYVGPRGFGTAECLNYSFSVSNPSQDPVVTKDPDRNRTIAAYTMAEFSLHARGERSAEEFGRRAKMWRELAEPDGTINSAYGHLIWYDRSTADGRTQWQWAKDRLLADRATRQAYILLSSSRTQREGVKDQVCTFAGQFLLRENRLHFSVVMRSNDVVRGLCYDMPFFCHLQVRMAAELGVLVGHYHHTAHSMHMYETDRCLALRMLGHVESSCS